MYSWTFLLCKNFFFIREKHIIQFEVFFLQIIFHNHRSRNVHMKKLWVWKSCWNCFCCGEKSIEWDVCVWRGVKAGNGEHFLMFFCLRLWMVCHPSMTLSTNYHINGKICWTYDGGGYNFSIFSRGSRIWEFIMLRMVLNVIRKKGQALNAISDHHYFYSAGVCAIQIVTRGCQCGRGKGDNWKGCS